MIIDIEAAIEGKWLIWDTQKLVWLREGGTGTGFRDKAKRWEFGYAMEIVSEANKDLKNDQEPLYTMTYDD